MLDWFQGAFNQTPPDSPHNVEKPTSLARLDRCTNPRPMAPYHGNAAAWAISQW